jgi:hypothetical protein
MSRHPWRAPLRALAIAAGVALPLLSAGIVQATLPGLPPFPSLPGNGQPVTVLVAPPSRVILTVPPQATECVVDMSYDNTGTDPMQSLFRGQTACGHGVYAPVMSGQVSLTDTLGNVVASGNAFGPVSGQGPDTSQGVYASDGSGIVDGVSGTGPVPGLDYTITFKSAITLTWPQYWQGPAGTGCSIAGQTLACSNTMTYSYIPGTKGGLKPS